MSKTSVAPARETKQFHFSCKAVDDDQGLIEAYGSVFDTVDQGDDTVKPGAFKRTIQNSKQRVQAGKAKFLAAMLWQHDANQPIGGWTDLKEDAHGLLCKGQIVLSTQLGKECYELIKAGVIDQFSIGYDIPSGGAFYDKSTGVRNLTELRLWEVSPVTFAMNQEALLVGVKGNTMPDDKKTVQRKTLLDHYNQEQAQALLEDWQDIYISSLTSSIFDAFTIGDTPQTDISQALDDFKELVLSKFVVQATECNLSQYIADSGFSYSPAASTLQNGSDDSGYGYMSRRDPLSVKKGAAISAANQSTIDAHVANLHDIADAATKSMKSAMTQVKSLHTAANDFATTIQGSEDPYQSDDDAPDTGRQEGKSKIIDGTSLLSDDELEKALLSLKSLQN
jgi:uncharacterized protein